MDLQAYADEALDAMESRALSLGDVDWPSLRSSTRAAAAAAQDVAEVHELLRDTVRRVGGVHSFLVPPDARGSSGGGTAELPTARAVDDVGVLHLPTCAGGREAMAAYAQAGTEALATVASSRRWIVDLRANQGGNMWPMLGVVAPLLGGDGVLGRFITRDGTGASWWLRRRWIGSGWRVHERSRGPRRLPGPVAVLLGHATASSGEAVAIAFRGARHVRSYGGPTRGLSTANDVVRLSDGASLVITTATMADRDGVVYGGPLSPDVHVDPPADALEVALADLADAPPHAWG